MTFRWLDAPKTINLEENPEPEQGVLGNWLGAAPIVVKMWMPEVAEVWDQMDAQQQQQAIATANQIKKQQDAQFANVVKEMRSRPGACDATVPGALAGQLKEYLIKKGADTAKLDADESVFGPKELAEWMRIFGAAPSVGDAETAVGTVWHGPYKITLGTFCQDVKLPTKVTAPVPKPKPVEPPVTGSTSKKKKSPWGLLLLAGSAVGALAFALFPKAPKGGLPPRKGERR